MVTVRQALAELESIAPSARAAGWDPVGLQVGDPSVAAGRIGVCHEVTAEVVAAAVEGGVGLLVSYHPLLFDPPRRFVSGPGPSGLAYRIARAGMALAVVHTAFDVAPGGTADALADALGLRESSPFGPLWSGESVKIVTFSPSDAVGDIASAMSRAGAGVIGDYTACSFRSEGIGTFIPGEGANPSIGRAGEESAETEVRLEMIAPARGLGGVIAALVRAHPYEEPAFDVFDRRGESGFVGRLGEFGGTLAGLGSSAEAALGGVLRIAGEPAQIIERVAVIPGSGAAFLQDAVAMGADAVVTGDVKHHDARSALSQGLAVLDPGHAATERPGVARLYAALAARWEDVLDLTGVDPDPWK